MSKCFSSVRKRCAPGDRKLRRSSQRAASKAGHGSPARARRSTAGLRVAHPQVHSTQRRDSFSLTTPHNIPRPCLRYG
jgi:hypothetical protein